ncbi:hypothetical protein [Amycolatopsis stemonae]
MRPIVMAGSANLVEQVNQQAPTAAGAGEEEDHQDQSRGGWR